MDIRSERQREFAEKWLASDRRSIIYAAPRFGKIFLSLNILDAYSNDADILIAYPDVKIRKSWEEDFDKRGYINPNVEFTTHLSLKKHVEKKYDLVIIDEIHLLSEAQIEVCKDLFLLNKHVLGLTGTLSSLTRRTLKNELSLDVLIEYPIEKAIEEGIVTDYEINIIKVPLDNMILQTFGKKRRTELMQFKSISWVIDKLESEGKDTFFMRLKRMRLIQNSIAKKDATKKLLFKYRDERVLVFCGITKIADSLGIPSYHSKVNEASIFNDFVNGKFNHLAVVKMGNTGVTYKPLNMIIINYFDSNSENLAQKINRAMSMEYNNPDKKAKIYIISSMEPVEQKWLNKALAFFDKSKIKYL
ncbi:MAG: hypothetical protein H5T96_09340 [Tissierellales bacterium]|nr:hypothetical protein [Tissierellales bacterium]